MAKKETVDRDLTKVQPPAGVSADLAKYMEEDDSLKSMQKRRVLPRIKIVQNTAGGSLAENFSPGDIVLMPGEALLAKVDKNVSDPPFLAVPLFYFEEYCFWSNLEDGDSPAVLERSYDPTHRIARNAKDRDKRFENYVWDSEENKLDINPGGKHVGRNVEHLNFACVIYDSANPLNGETCVLSYSRGEIGTGTQFISACSMRKIPLWSQVWEFTVAKRERGASRKWWGLDYRAPEVNTIVDGHIEQMRSLHLDIKKSYEDRLLVVDHEGNSDADAEEVSGGDF